MYYICKCTCMYVYRCMCLSGCFFSVIFCDGCVHFVWHSHTRSYDHDYICHVAMESHVTITLYFRKVVALKLPKSKDDSIERHILSRTFTNYSKYMYTHTHPPNTHTHTHTHSSHTHTHTHRPSISTQLSMTTSYRFRPEWPSPCWGRWTGTGIRPG